MNALNELRSTEPSVLSMLERNKMLMPIVAPGVIWDKNTIMHIMSVCFIVHWMIESKYSEMQ